MPVIGVGGIFFRAKDPEALRAWYREHLGVGTGKYGKWDQAAGTAVFAPFSEGTDYFPADKAYMLNFRVSDLLGLLDSLRRAGIEAITNPEWDASGVGRFARIHDPEGNPIELWEPAS